jgi:hypothetical protein
MSSNNASVVRYIPPIGEFQPFSDEDEYRVKGQEWGLFSGRSIKHEFSYKTNGFQGKVKMVGYQTYGSGYDTIIVQFEDDQLSCIHPAYLKEMQSSNFGKERLSGTVVALVQNDEKTEEAPVQQTLIASNNENKPKRTKKEKQPKLDLPQEKVHFTAVIKEFTSKMNHFTGEEDEIILLENVRITSEEELFVGHAWCAYSKTLKKLELQEGDNLEFDGKIVEKKFNKEILYKVNNPSKLAKAE